MHQDFLQEARKEIADWLFQEYKNIKFTVKFGGEFFIAAADKALPVMEIGGRPGCVSRVQPQGNRLIIHLSHDWLEDKIGEIDEADCKDTDLALYSQVKRLEKQIGFGLCGGEWDGGMHLFARDILYMMHTKSAGIRSNIVKKCAREYNKLQRQGCIPDHLVAGYKNALCQISKLRG